MEPDWLRQDSRETEQDLLHKLRSAEQCYREAQAETERIQVRVQDLPVGHPDGNHAYLQATRNQRIALTKYRETLAAYSYFRKARRTSPALEAEGWQSTPLGVLTAREKEVLRLIAEDLSTKEIARKLGITFKTAACHRSRVMDKLGIHSVVGLVRYAIREKLIEP